MLDLVELKRKMGEFVWKAMFQTMQKFDVPMNKLVCVTTDGDAVMKGQKGKRLKARLWAHCRGKNYHQLKFLHCVIHQEQLCKHAFIHIKHITDKVIAIGKYIRKSSLRHHAFKHFFEVKKQPDVEHSNEIDLDNIEHVESDIDNIDNLDVEDDMDPGPGSTNKVMPDHSPIRWLTLGTLCKAIYRQTDRITQFTGVDQFPELTEASFRNDFAFSVDILEEMNVLCQNLMGTVTYRE